MLSQSDAPASGEHAFSVTLWNAATGGEPIWSDELTTQVTRGVFDLALGANKPLPKLGDATWISVAIDGGPPVPRSQLSAVPYALTSNTLSTDYVSSISVNGERLTGRSKDVNIVTGDGIRATLDPASSNVMISLTSTRSSKGARSQSTLSGAGTSTLNTCTTNDDGGVGNNLVVGGCDNVLNASSGSGTTHHQVIVGGSTNTTSGNGTEYTFIGGGYENSINDGIYGVIVGGHSNHLEEERAFIGGGEFNWVGGPKSVIGGGENNIVSFKPGSSVYPSYYTEDDTWDVIGGGDSNKIDTGSIASMIGGGHKNRMIPNYSFIGGGDTNLIDKNSHYSVIAGGEYNRIDTSSTHAVIAGGYENEIESFASHTAIVSGQNNRILRDPAGLTNDAAIVGGNNNKVQEAASFIGGGQNNLAVEEFSAVLGGTENEVYADHSSIAGGKGNTIDSAAPFNGILSGLDNTIHSSNSGIGSGTSNLIDNIGTLYDESGSGSFIGSGFDNQIRARNSFIGSGDTNRIEPFAHYSMIGGGDHNYVDALAHHSGIAAGHFNYVGAHSSIIAGGDSNIIEAPANDHQVGDNAILGGSQNTIKTETSNDPQTFYAAIVGGRLNIAHEYAAFVGGGEYNKADEEFSSVIAGQSNSALSPWAIVGGGLLNTVSLISVESGIFSGESNLIVANSAAIAGGVSNHIVGSGAGINDIEELAEFSFIGAGDSNLITARRGSIGGGQSNEIDALAHHATIGGGEANYIGESSDHSVVGGGQYNLATSYFATIAGGGGTDPRGGGGGELIADLALSPSLPAVRLSFTGNQAPGPYTSIGGGGSNFAYGPVSTISGGANNATVGMYSTVAGGEGLLTYSYGQTAVGYYNYARGTFTRGTSHMYSAGGPQDEPLFMVGNGDSHIIGLGSNAFEVSYDGHSTVTDVNGTDPITGRVPFYGATYQDNTVVAWAEVDANGTMVSGFGVNHIMHPMGTPQPGAYVVYLESKDPNGNPINFSNASITVTLRNNDTSGWWGTTDSKGINLLDPTLVINTSKLSPTGCGKIDATQLGIFLPPKQNVFIVHTYDGSTFSGGCNLHDKPFFLKVCARP